jgi:hypothetical protein
MSLTRNFDVIQTQTFDIFTDLRTTYGIACPLTCSLVSPPAYISQSGSTITVTSSSTSSSDVGPHTINIQCVSSNFPGSVTAVTYSFILTIQECVASSMSIPSIPSSTQAINSGSLVIQASPATWSNLACVCSATYTTTMPAFVVFDPVFFKFTSNPTLPAQVGIHTITLTASIPQLSLGPTGIKQVSTTFTLTITNDCSSTSITDQTILDMSV